MTFGAMLKFVVEPQLTTTAPDGLMEPLASDVAVMVNVSIANVAPITRGMLIAAVIWEPAIAQPLVSPVQSTKW